MSAEENKDIRQEIRLTLTKRSIMILFSYYIALLITGFILLIWYAINSAVNINLNKDAIKVLGVLTGSLCGSSISYLRKLYKDCIQEKILIEKLSMVNIKFIGTFIYYATRPLVGMVLSFLVIFGTEYTIFILSQGNENFGFSNYYAIIIISFIISFATGRILRKVEIKSQKIDM